MHEAIKDGLKYNARKTFDATTGHENEVIESTRMPEKPRHSTKPDGICPPAKTAMLPTVAAAS